MHQYKVILCWSCTLSWLRHVGEGNMNLILLFVRSWDGPPGRGFSFLASLLNSTQFWSWDDEEAWLIKQGEKPASNNTLLMTSSSTLLTYKYFLLSSSFTIFKQTFTKGKLLQSIWSQLTLLLIMFFVLWVRKKILYFLISSWQLCCQGELLRPDTIVEVFV